MLIKTKKHHIDHGLGFPIKLLNVPMCKMRGEWTPAINYNLLSKLVLHQLCCLESKLSGNHVRFIRLYFEMTLQQFAERFGITHPGVIKWENMRGEPTGMTWAIEKDVRLFILCRLSKKSKELVSLYRTLEKVINKTDSIYLEIDLRKLAA